MLVWGGKGLRRQISRSSRLHRRSRDAGSFRGNTIGVLQWRARAASPGPPFRRGRRAHCRHLQRLNHEPGPTQVKFSHTTLTFGFPDRLAQFPPVAIINWKVHKTKAFFSFSINLFRKTVSTSGHLALNTLRASARGMLFAIMLAPQKQCDEILVRWFLGAPACGATSRAGPPTPTTGSYFAPSLSWVPARLQGSHGLSRVLRRTGPSSYRTHPANPSLRISQGVPPVPIRRQFGLGKSTAAVRQGLYDTGLRRPQTSKTPAAWTRVARSTSRRCSAFEIEYRGKGRRRLLRSA